MVSKIAQTLFDKLSESHYREELMQSFLNMAELPNQQRPSDHYFPKEVRQETVMIEGHTVQQLSLPEATKGELMLIHGGGFILPRSRSFNRLALSFLKMGYKLTLPDYPLAPAGLPDIREWMVQVYRAWQQQTKGPHFIFGDSAGANIALRLAFDIRDQQLPPVNAIALVSLCPDLAFDVDAKAQQQDLVLDAQIMRDLQGNQAYQAFDFMHEAHYEALGHIRLDTGTEEINAHAVERLARKMQAAEENQIELVMHTGMIHDFVFWQMLPEAQSTLNDLDDYFQRYQ